MPRSPAAWEGRKRSRKRTTPGMTLVAALGVLTAVFTSILAFAFLYSFIGTNFICDCATASADGTTDKGAFSPTEERSSHCAACRRAADDLCSGVVAMIMGGLLALGTFVALGLCLPSLRKS
jgi:hypothetical protein